MGRCVNFEANPFKPTHCKNCHLLLSQHEGPQQPPARPPPVAPRRQTSFLSSPPDCDSGPSVKTGGSEIRRLPQIPPKSGTVAQGSGPSRPAPGAASPLPRSPAPARSPRMSSVNSNVQGEDGRAGLSSSTGNGPPPSPQPRPVSLAVSEQPPPEQRKDSLASGIATKPNTAPKAPHIRASVVHIDTEDGNPELLMPPPRPAPVAPTSGRVASWVKGEGAECPNPSCAGTLQPGNDECGICGAGVVIVIDLPSEGALSPRSGGPPLPPSASGTLTPAYAGDGKYKHHRPPPPVPPSGSPSPGGLAAIRPTSPLPPVPGDQGESSRGPEEQETPVESGERLDDSLTMEDEDTVLVSIPEKAVVIEPLPPPFQPKNHREFLVVEILSTERTYVTNLKCLVETMLIPLRKQHEPGSSERPVISMENIQILFSNVREILSVNQALLSELESRINAEAWNDTTCIGDAIRRLIPFLKMYRNYTANYEKAQIRLFELEARNPQFVLYKRKWEQEVPKLDMIPLLSYLILPVQRIPRYNLLLRDLLKQTDENHPDYATLRLALQEMEQVAQYINDEIQKAEARSKIIALQNQFLSMSGFELIVPHRELLFEGELMKVCRKAHKPRQFFLFNDGLMYAEIMVRSQQSSGSRYIVSKFMPISSLKVKDVEDSDTMKYKNAFVIRSSQKSFVVYAETPEDKQKWITRVEKTIEKVNSNTATKQIEEASDYEAPVWIPDDASPKCLLCQKDFTFINRRHHCRACGRVVCGACSSKRLTLSGPNLQRVCNICFEEKMGKDGDNMEAGEGIEGSGTEGKESGAEGGDSDTSAAEGDGGARAGLASKPLDITAPGEFTPPKQGEKGGSKIAGKTGGESRFNIFRRTRTVQGSSSAEPKGTPPR